jgi:hypothetical protein
MTQLRIFSYLPNPRVWKATIAARLTGIDIEVRGSSPRETPIMAVGLRCVRAAAGRSVGFKGALHKTEAFLKTHQFGTVPAAFSPDVSVGIFESNSIMRAVARLG